jgi:hypothetical protein
LEIQNRKSRVPYKLREENFTEPIYIKGVKHLMTPVEHSLEGLRLVLLPKKDKSGSPLYCKELNIAGEYYSFVFVRRDYFRMMKSDTETEFDLYHEMGHIVLGHLLEVRGKRIDPLERLEMVLKNGTVHSFELEADRYAVEKVGKIGGMYSLTHSINAMEKKLEEHGHRATEEQRERARLSIEEMKIRREIIRKM